MLVGSPYNANSERMSQSDKIKILTAQLPIPGGFPNRSIKRQTFSVTVRERNGNTKQEKTAQKRCKSRAISRNVLDSGSPNGGLGQTVWRFQAIQEFA